MGNRIKQDRKAKGWTQEQLAECIGKTKQTVSLMEKNRMPVSDSMMLKIKKCLDDGMKGNRKDSIGYKIMMARTAKELTLLQLSKLTGIHPMNLSRYERGREPKRKTLERIAKALGKDVSCFYPGEKEKLPEIIGEYLKRLDEKMDLLISKIERLEKK